MLVVEAMTMMADASVIDAPEWAIRPEQPIDLDLIHDLHRAAFGGGAEAELVDAIRSSASFVPELSLVAVTADGSILGHALLSIVALESDDGLRHDILALAPVAVLPPHQGRGIGSGLVRAALAAADQRTEALSVVLGSAAFYARFGYVPATEVGIRGPYEEAGDAFRIRARPGVEHIPAGTVVYSPPFDAA